MRKSKTLVAVLAAIIAFTGLAACSKATVVPDVQNVVVAPAALPVDTSSAEDTPAACPTDNVQTVTPDPILNRFIEGGLKGLPGDMNAQVLTALGHSHLYMVIIGETLFKTSIDDKTLVNETGECLSDTGRALMSKFQGAFAMLTASDTTVTTGYNTGISGGKVVVDTSGAIYGDTSAIKFVDRNGNVVLILLRRCGNVVLPSPGTYPPGTTDNPPPPQGNPPPPSNAKNAKDSVNAVQGTTPLAQTKPVTNGKASSDQKSTGATSGNVTDNKVPAGTGSGTTTTDLGSSTGSSPVTAPGATSGGDSTAGTTSGAGQTSTGGANGTGGAVVITNPNG